MTKKEDMMPDEIRVLAFSGCCGCEFNQVSFEKPLSLKPRFIGYDQDSIDLVPSHPGNGEAASVDRHLRNFRLLPMLRRLIKR